MEGHFLTPGDPGEISGGHIYNRRMLAALAERGCHLHHHVLPGHFPEPDAEARAAARAYLAELPADALVVIDGLALGGLPDEVEAEAERLRIVALMHLPLAAETGVSPEQLRARGIAEERALAACRRIIANSQFTREELVHRGFASESIDVAPPGTEAAPIASGSASAGVPTLISVAAVTPRKGQDLLVDALTELTDLDWHCRIVGSLERNPDFAEEVRSAIAAAGLEGRIELLGELEGEVMEAVWDGADLTVLASRYEGFGMVITEAVARGLPVVATAGGAVAEALPAGAGVLAAPGDVAALRDVLREVLGDEALRAELVAGARSARDRLPDWASSAEQFAAALQRAQA